MPPARDALGQIQHHQHEDQAHHHLPGLHQGRRLAGRGLQQVDQDGAHAGPQQGRPAAHRGPHHHADGERQVHEAGRGEFGHHHVEHAGHGGDAGREREEEGLVVRHVEAQVAGTLGVFARGLQDQASARGHQQPGAHQHHRQGAGDEVVGRQAERVEFQPADAQPGQVGQAVEAIGERLRIDQQQAHQQHHRERDDRDEDTGDPLAEYHRAQHEGDHHRQQQPHRQAEALVLERLPQERAAVDAAQIDDGARLGVGQHEVRHRAVRPRLLAGGARELEGHGEHVRAQPEEQPLPQVQDAGIAPAQGDGHAQHAVHQVLGDAVEPEGIEHQRGQGHEQEEGAVGSEGRAPVEGGSHGSAPFEREKSLRPHDDEQDHQAEDHGPSHDVVGQRGDHAVDLAQHARRHHRAQQAAQAARHHDEEAVHHQGGAHVGRYGLEARHQHACDARQARAEGEGPGIDALHVDAARRGHARVADDRAHLHADGGAVEEEPGAEREHRRARHDERAVGIDGHTADLHDTLQHLRHGQVLQPGPQALHVDAEEAQPAFEPYRLLYQDRHAPGRQQRVGQASIELADHAALDQQAEQRGAGEGQRDRGDQPPSQPDLRQYRGVGADHDHFPMGHVDHAHGAVSDDQPQRHQQQYRAHAQADEEDIQHMVPMENGRRRRAGWRGRVAPGSSGLDVHRTLGGAHQVRVGLAVGEVRQGPHGLRRGIHHLALPVGLPLADARRDPGMQALRVDQHLAAGRVVRLAADVGADRIGRRGLAGLHRLLPQEHLEVRRLQRVVGDGLRVIDELAVAVHERLVGRRVDRHEIRHRRVAAGRVFGAHRGDLDLAGDGGADRHGGLRHALVLVFAVERDDRVAHHVGQHGVGPRLLDLAHHAGPLGVAELQVLVAHPLRARLLDQLLADLGHLAGIDVVGADDEDLLLAQLVDHPRDVVAQLLVGHGAAVHHVLRALEAFVVRLVEQHRIAALEHRQHRLAAGRGVAAEHRRDAVAHHQLGRLLVEDLRVGSAVFHHHLDLAAHHAAGGVDLGHGHQHAIGQHLLHDGEASGLGIQGTDLDGLGSVGRAHPRRCREGGRGGSGRGEETTACRVRHGGSLLTGRRRHGAHRRIDEPGRSRTSRQHCRAQAKKNLQARDDRSGRLHCLGLASVDRLPDQPRHGL